MQEYREHSDRLLARIEQEQFVVEKHRKEIEDNALKLRDGRRVYVDGNEYRDEQGRVLQGRDRDEAAPLHNQNPNASTWQERQKTIDEADDLERLKQKVLNDRQEAERRGDVSAAKAPIWRRRTAPIIWRPTAMNTPSRRFPPSPKRLTDRRKLIARIPRPKIPDAKCAPAGRAGRA